MFKKYVTNASAAESIIWNLKLPVINAAVPEKMYVRRRWRKEKFEIR